MNIRELRDIDAAALPSVIWDWCSRPEPEEIDSSLKRFAQLKIGKVFLRASNGLVIKYLSDDFFELVRTAARRCAKYGLKLYICDEYGKSSGTGGGEITSVPDNRLKDFVYVTDKEIEKTDILISDDGAKKLVLRDMSLQRSSGRYATADITDAFATQCFSETVYDEYFRQCKRFIGYEIAGFATSINMPSKTLYSKSASKEAQTGASLLSTGKQYDEEKAKYYSNFNKALDNNFTKYLQEKCANQGISFSAGVSGELFVSRQLSYLSSDMPYAEIESDNIDIVQIKMLTSICSQFGKTPLFRLITPSFSKCENRFSSAMFLSSFGANICFDSIAYSMTDRRKYEKNNTTLSDFAENDMSDMIARLTMLSSKTKDNPDILLVFPSREINCSNSNEVYSKFKEIADKLFENRIAFHIADEYILENSAVKNGKLIIGANTYSKLMLPDFCEFYESTTKIANEMGKSTVLSGEFEFALQNDILSGNGNFHCEKRTDGEVVYFFVTAIDDCDITYNQNGNLFIFDPSDGEAYRIEKESFNIKKGHTAVLFTAEDLQFDIAPPVVSGVSFASYKAERSLPFELCEADENLLPLKTVNACFGRKPYREALIDDLHKEFYALNEGESVRVKYPFTVNGSVGTVFVYIENALPIENATLNGTPLPKLEPSQKDSRYFGADITNLIADGKNTLMLEYKKHNNYKPNFESRTPSYYTVYDLTSFEPVVLAGDFDCDDNALYPSGSISDSMPYYYGRLVYQVPLPDTDLAGQLLSVKGDFDICKIRIGKREKYFFTDEPMFELFNLDSAGVAEVTLYNTPYNLLRKSGESAESFGITNIDLIKEAED